MAGQRLPLEVLQARGAKHLTKAEIQDRSNGEIKPITDAIIAPSYLKKKQKETFNQISEQLDKLGIMGETDVDALSRYIISNDLYIKANKQLAKKEVQEDLYLFEYWSKKQDQFFKQARASANDLGLTISSRCRLCVPKTTDESSKKNKFEKFEKREVV